MNNLDELMGESETPWAESIADTIAQSVENQVDQGLIDEKIIQVLKSDLEERDREIILRLFGFEGNPLENAEEIGQALGLRRERIRQIKEKDRFSIAIRFLEPEA